MTILTKAERERFTNDIMYSRSNGKFLPGTDDPRNVYHGEIADVDTADNAVLHFGSGRETESLSRAVSALRTILTSYDPERGALLARFGQGFPGHYGIPSVVSLAVECVGMLTASGGWVFFLAVEKITEDFGLSAGETDAVLEFWGETLETLSADRERRQRERYNR